MARTHSIVLRERRAILRKVRRVYESQKAMGWYGNSSQPLKEIIEFISDMGRKDHGSRATK